ncbi:unnamed protein product, partial [Discosporangium mesarthrocarpum]
EVGAATFLDGRRRTADEMVESQVTGNRTGWGIVSGRGEGKAARGRMVEEEEEEAAKGWSILNFFPKDSGGGGDEAAKGAARTGSEAEAGLGMGEDDGVAISGMGDAGYGERGTAVGEGGLGSSKDAGHGYDPRLQVEVAMRELMRSALDRGERLPSPVQDPSSPGSP